MTVRADAPDTADRARARATMAALAIGYMGIYLCRKNLSVAVPLLTSAFGTTKAEIGRVASVSTAAYALGKILLGPLVDRLGGRAGFLASLALVALCSLGASAAPSLFLLTAAYGANRFAGAGGWPSMMKLVPTWYDRERGTVVAALSVSYALGGVAAAVLSSAVLDHGGGWRAVMAVPAFVLGAITVGAALVVRAGPFATRAVAATADRAHSEQGAGSPPRLEDATHGAGSPPRLEDATHGAGSPPRLEDATHGAGSPPRAEAPWRALFRRPQFRVVCALSLTLTLMREAFNTWNVDFLASVERQGAQALGAAALKSTAFDVAGAVAILLMGVAYDRTPVRARRFLIAGILALLSGVLAVLPGAAAASPGAAMWMVGAVGLLVYGPYSLLAGVFAVESGGAEAAATAAGIIDAIGYVAGILAGEALGRLLDFGGYALGFSCLSAITAASALLALRLDARAARS